MACRHLKDKMVKQPMEIGGSITPEYSREPICQLNRPNEIGWLYKCRDTPEDGPCWLWIQEHGTDIPDKEFMRNSK